MGLLSKFTDSIFGKKEQQPRLYEEPEQKQAKGVASEFMREYKPTAYTGQMTAGMSPTEEAGQGVLSKYIGRDMPELYGAAESEIMKTLQGGYDPATSDYYKAMRDEIDKQAGIGSHRLAQSGLKVGAPQSATMTGLSQLEGNRQGSLAQVMAELGLQERQNKLGVLGQAQSLGSTMDNMDLSSLEAVKQYGALPRELEQSGLSANYADWLRTEEDKKTVPGYAMDFLQTYKPDYTAAGDYGMGESRFKQGTDILSGITSLFI